MRPLHLLVMAAALAAALLAAVPASAQPEPPDPVLSGTCADHAPAGWAVIEARAIDRGLICNYRMERSVGGVDQVSGTAVTVEYYCTPAQGQRAFEVKTHDRGDIETQRTPTRVVIEEGPGARNPDNLQSGGVFSEFFPDVVDGFALFEKAWVAFNPQVVATIVVLTDEGETLDAAARFGVDDVEPVARRLADANRPDSPDCPIPGSAAGGGTGGDAPTGAPGSPGSAVAPRGGAGDLVIPVLAAAGLTAVVIIAGRTVRKRLRLKPPRQYPGGRSNPWDPAEDEQRARWARDRTVWDPQTLSWRDPRASDFETIPERPPPVERQIPEDRVPTKCLRAYTRYSTTQAKAVELARQIEAARIRLTQADRRFGANILRANAQLGIDVGAAVAGISLATVDAARVALRPKGGRIGSVAAVSEEALGQLRARVKDLKDELGAARSRLARSQQEAQLVPPPPPGAARAAADAASEVADLTKQLAGLGEPTELLARQAAQRAEAMRLRTQLTDVERAWKERAWKGGRGAELREAIEEVGEELAAAKAGKVVAPDWDESGFRRIVGEVLDAKAEGQLTGAEAGRIRAEALRGKYVDAPAGDRALRNRVRELTARRKELEAIEKAELATVMEAPLTPVEQKLVQPEAGRIQQRLHELAAAEDRLDGQIYEARRATAAPRERLEGQLAAAKARHRAALADQEQATRARMRARKDAGVVRELERQLAAKEAELTQISGALAALAKGRSPGALPAVTLGALLAAVSPAAAATVLVGLAAAKAADALGIGPQSPEEIWRIILRNKGQLLVLEQELTGLETSYTRLVRRLPRAADELSRCMSAADTPVDPHPPTPAP
ncbi:hypothetical protein ACFQE5_04955 [Pseudonocardia hispaniensis]|uniref:Chromosome partition protein Smc n=1 Tax=Pseudonocardia hispaniensis TaxID=904933 RepID=A0ABW1IZB7_9PSEU